MKILAIDSSTKFFSAAISENKDHIAEINLELGKQLSSELIAVFKDLLSKAKLCLGDIDGFCAGLGPGSFTGLRIGISTMKGFTLALGKPLLGVSSLDALAYNAKMQNGLICPIIDAKRDNLYSCLYEFRENRLIKKSGYLLISIKSLIKKINKPVVFLGDGIGLYKKELLKKIKHALFLPEDYWYPRAGVIIDLCYPRFRRIKKFNRLNINPVYLYPKECQIKGVDTRRLSRR